MPFSFYKPNFGEMLYKTLGRLWQPYKLIQTKMTEEIKQIRELLDKIENSQRKVQKNHLKNHLSFLNFLT